jgi:hypothetical protein
VISLTEQVDSSAPALRELGAYIVKSMRHLDELNADLLTDMNRLSVTFRDEGIQAVQSYVRKSKMLIEETFPELQMLISKLNEYAQWIEDSQRRLSVRDL